MGVGEGWQGRGLSSVGVGGLWRSGALKLSGRDGPSFACWLLWWW